VVSLVLFLVASRYRVPVLPVLMVFAGHAVVWMWDRLRARAWRPLAVAMAFLFGFSAWAVGRGPGPRAVQANGYLLLGSAEATRGHHREAAAHLRRALEFEPDRADVLVKLAWSERMLGDDPAAIGHYRRAVNLAPLQREALDGLLDLALADGRSAEAEQWIDRYLISLTRMGLEPKSEVAYYFRGRIRSERGDRDGARADFAKALDSDSRSFRAALELGDLECDAARWSEAGVAYQHAILALGPFVPSADHDRAYAGLVHALVQQGRRSQACEQASVWTARRPRSRAAWTARQESCERAGERPSTRSEAKPGEGPAVRADRRSGAAVGRMTSVTARR